MSLDFTIGAVFCSVQKPKGQNDASLINLVCMSDHESIRACVRTYTLIYLYVRVCFLCVQPVHAVLVLVSLRVCV